MQVRIKRVDATLPLPQYQTAGAAAFDLYSRIDTVMEPKIPKLLPTNLIIEVPPGHVLILSARSSTMKRGLALRNAIGVIDQDFHGPEDEVFLPVYNFTDAPVKIKRGERIAQGMIIPVERAEWQEVEKIKDDSRGGFGSTGI
ncbi:MAG: dUTP diphosphatase [Candidatus Liptonbacteria bacterium]|nr:dUTP diphosphatase [Candidatus Liptonbacteria bacterium]